MGDSGTSVKSESFELIPFSVSSWTYSQNYKRNNSGTTVLPPSLPSLCLTSASTGTEKKWQCLNGNLSLELGHLPIKVKEEEICAQTVLGNVLMGTWAGAASHNGGQSQAPPASGPNHLPIWGHVKHSPAHCLGLRWLISHPQNKTGSSDSFVRIIMLWDLLKRNGRFCIW